MVEFAVGKRQGLYLINKHTTQTGNSSKAYLLLTVTALCWGGNAIFGRLAVGEVSPMVLVSLRWLAVLLLLSFIARQQVRRDWPRLRQRLLFVAGLGVFGFTGFNALFYIAAHSTSAVNIGILQGSVPVFVLLGAFVVYRTRVTILQLIGVLITVLGVAIVASAGHLTQLITLQINKGDLLMLGACFFYAVYAVALIRKPQVSALSLFTVMAAAAFITSLPLTAIEFVAGQWQWPTMTGWLVVIFVALFPSFLAQIFFIQGVELIGPGRAGIFVNLVPVFASILAVVFLQEPFQVFHAIALSLVLGGIWVAERAKKTIAPVSRA